MTVDDSAAYVSRDVVWLQVFTKVTVELLIDTVNCSRHVVSRMHTAATSLYFVLIQYPSVDFSDCSVKFLDYSIKHRYR